MSLHDAELECLKQHYEDHKELFDGVHQWEESWTHFLELEVSLTGEGNEHLTATITTVATKLYSPTIHQPIDNVADTNSRNSDEHTLKNPNSMIIPLHLFIKSSDTMLE